MVENAVVFGYTDFGKVSSITEGDWTYTIAYSPDGARAKSYLTDGNGSYTTRYYGNGTEKAVGSNYNLDYLSYLCHGAIVVHHGTGRSPLPPTPTAILQGYYDAQGSLIALVDANGFVVQRYAYDPWGRRVNPEDWAQADTTHTDVYHINRGYTMHEHLMEFGLINMNGRVFDPAVAQFLSPDNYIQADGNWLNYNRYAYCLNNPLKYTDPSGEIIGTVFTCLFDFGVSLYNSVFNIMDGDWKGLHETWRSFDPTAPWSETYKEFQIYKGLFMTDESLPIEQRIGRLINRFTYELPQTIAGYITTTVRNMCGNVDEVDYYGGATFCIHKVPMSCADSYRGYTIGNYINIRIKDNMSEGFEKRVRTDGMFMHEYGHYLQSQSVGLGYLFIAACSGINCERLKRKILKHNSRFHYTWTETWANRLAAEYFSQRESVDWENDYFKHFWQGRYEMVKLIDVYPF